MVTQEEVAARTEEHPASSPLQPAHGAALRTYQLAVAATGEYTESYGGTVSGAMNAIVTTINRVNGIYERDLAVRMILVANNSSIVYTNASTDPYTHDNPSAMLCQNAQTLDAVIGISNYDIGHVFDTAGGGLASPNSVCNGTNVCGSPSGSYKGQGMSGLLSPHGDSFDVQYVAHEIGHQFSASHTFNGTTGACSISGGREASTAFEPGGGSTIMSYAGTLLCGAESLQNNTDAYFHAGSQDQIIAFITSATCPTQPSPTGNVPPTVNAGADYTIPQSTPFTLTAVGDDADADYLTYTWEEMDLGTPSPPSTDDGSRPIFRSFLPNASPSRTFPKLSDILNNTTTFGESLPTTTRSMNFRVTARDNRLGGGGTASDDMVLSVRADSGPFLVTQPDAPVTWPAGSSQTVSWSVANTADAPVSCTNVRISLSTDGGTTFPTILVASTPNDGSEAVTIPNLPNALGSDQGRGRG